MKPRDSRADAFSLAEITLAIGIAAFCLITIFGLLTVGITVNKTAVEQTVANGILSEVVSDLRATPRTIPRGQAALSPQFAMHLPANPAAAAPADTALYFTSEGKMTAAADSARYRITVTFIPNGTAVKTATFVRLRASWPAAVPMASAAGAVETFCALDRN